MRPLVAGDPDAIDGYHLLARLGVGGMGVVYLARARSGTLVALKLIRAEYAAEPEFRVRFRREAATVLGLRGPWLVPALAADAEAAEPWLATAFVPGPALTEVVDGQGPLPLTSVRILGARLAGALTEVHRAGLVHRDVKPGNVLLALDGPRLIDFGIARSAGATKLTGTGVVIGSPGFLAPEQACAEDRLIGPPTDVFALGCVLAFASSGRRPFGTGHAAAVVFRTVHEAPELEAVPAGLRALLASCLDKDPANRPGTGELADALGGQAAGVEWLPPGVVRTVAERSARALEVPPRRPHGTEGGGTSAQQPVTYPSRRRVLALGGGAVLAVGGGVAVYLAARGGAGSAKAGGPRTVPEYTVGLQADLSGADPATGLAHQRGAQLAVDAHNARTDEAFRLRLSVLDDRGEAQSARDIAGRFVADARVCAVIGPTSQATAEATRDVYEQARMPVVLVSVDASSLTQNDPVTVCMTRASDEDLWLPLQNYLRRLEHVTRTAVIYDLSSGSTGLELVSRLEQYPPGSGSVTMYQVAPSGDFGEPVRAAIAARTQAVVFAGTTPARAAACARTLTGAGFTGPHGSVWQTMGADFLSVAGPSAEGWVFGAPFTDSTALTAFATAHRKRYGVAPGRWSAEAYDAVGLIAQALGAHSAGRGTLAQRILEQDYQGLTKRLQFDPLRDVLADDTDALFLYQVQNGGFRFLGQYLDVAASQLTR